ncbi:hypothetical protein C4579_03300 [Candidatus Microgenomates bacterium]|nr:MAG: hypothetical protein C4579_03300 [Candidatus Microgenomates bacterium]
MLELIIILLVVFWFLGYIRIEGLTIADINLFVINGQQITLWKLLIFFLILWAIGVLPSPFRQIAAVLMVLWVLATLGIIAIAGLSNILIIAIIAGIVLSVAGR